MSTNIFKTNGIIARIIMVFVLMVCISSSIACRQKDSVTYEVTGDAELVDIAISDSDGDMERYEDMTLPWRRDYGDFEQDYLYLYAYNTGDSGTVNITIYVNGKVFKSATTSGGYTSAVVVGNK
ncbi:MAG: MmpS family transport accessory protein [Chloroflexi bacterium]|nr:MmpS family transport accessory protein [Chloroflexota bacterium]